jgi:microcystin-dependent protein
MTPTLGEIRMFGGNFAPRSWALCDGQLLPINQNQALFSILGTTYGGDGRTTFALPDLRSRVPISAGQGPGLSNHSQGQRSGSATTTLSSANLPPHTHIPTSSGSFSLGAGAASTTTGAGNSLAAASSINIFSTADPTPAASLRGTPISGTVNVSPNGGSQSFNNYSPYQVVNYIIALQGIFPSRN